MHEVRLRGVTRRECDFAAVADVPCGELFAANEPLPLPRVALRRLDLLWCSLTPRDGNDLLLSVDGGLEPLQDDVHLVVGNDAGILEGLRVLDHPVLGRWNAILLANLAETNLVIQVHHHLEAAREPDRLWKAVGEPVPCNCHEKHLVDRADRHNEVDLLLLHDGTQVLDPVVELEGVQLWQFDKLVACEAQRRRGDGLVVRHDDSGADLPERANHVEALRLSSGGNQHGLAVADSM
mmetsp:Transcript_8291/g.24895  ORF Transcript_8291/g.24895 Transcript_8291/m.24895 type:complete len:237 (+) Transcript_8291:4078-4788(+)